MLEKALKGSAYDCVVIGGGLRIPPKSLALFETVVNIIHKAAPLAVIAFNTRPEDTADAAARQLKATRSHRWQARLRRTSATPSSVASLVRRR